MSRLNIPYNNKTVTSVVDATTPDIINAIHRNLPRATRQIDAQTADFFKGATTKQTARNIFDFLKKNITYVADGENQDIRLPGRFVATATGDCKSYSLFTGAVLSRLGIPFVFRYASYTPDPTPQHIYVVIPNQGSPIIIDAVYGHFNQEKPFTYKTDYPMNVRTLSGTGTRPVGSLKDAWEKTKTALLAPARGPYLLLLRTNIFGWATILNAYNTKRPQKLKDKWNSLGGNYTDLKAAIAAGASKRPIFNKNVAGPGIGFITEADLTAAAGIIAAMVPIIAAGKLVYKELTGKDFDTEFNDSKVKVNPGNQQPGSSSSNNYILPIALAGAALLLLSKK